MAYEDVGLRARIEGVSSYTRDAQKIQAETKRIEQSMADTARGVNQQATSLIRSLAPVAGAIAGAFAAKLGVDMFKGALMAASDLSESVNKVDVVFEDAADTVKSFADNAAQAFGLSKNEALSAAGTFGNLFKNIGLTTKQSAEFSNQLVQNAADLASFNNIDPTQVLDKLRAGLSGEAEPLRVLGIDVSDTRLQIEALSQGITKSTQDMTQAEKVALRYAAIQKQMGAASGDFARTSDGVANSLRRAQAAIAEARVELGNRLLPVLQPIISAFASGIPGAVRALTPVLDGIGVAVKNAVAGLEGAFNIGKSIASAFAGGDVKTAFALIRESFTTWVAPAVGDMLKEIGKIPSQVASLIKTYGPEIAAGFADWATRAGQWAIDALPTIEANLKKLAGSVTTWAGQQVTTLANSLTPWTQTFGKNLDKWWEQGKPKLDTLKRNIIAWIDGTGISIDAGTAGWAQKFTKWIDTVNAEIVPKLNIIKRDIDQAAGDIVEALGRRLGQGAADAAGALLDGLDKTIRGGKGQVEGASLQLVAAILFPFAGIAAEGASIGARFAQGIVSGLTGGLPQKLEDLTGGRGIFAPRPPALQGNFVGPVLPTAPTPISATMPQLTADEIRKAIEADLPPENPTFVIDMSKLGGTPTGTPGEGIEDIIAEINRIPPAAATAGQQAGANLAAGLTSGGGGGGAAKQAVDTVKASLADLEAQGKANLAQLEAASKDLEMAIRGVDAAIRGMATIRLPGMEAAEDAIFELEQQMARARLAELGMGDATSRAADRVKDAGKDLGAAFDELSAQQREVREGIPVALQRWQFEQQQAAQRAAQQANATAKPATSKEAEKQSEIISKQIEAARLRYQLQYAADQRAWAKEFGKATGAIAPEMDLEDQVAQLWALVGRKNELNSQQETLNERTEAEKATLARINELQENGETTMEDVNVLVNEILGSRQESIAAEETLLGLYEDQRDVLAEAAAIVGKAFKEAGMGAPPIPAEPDIPGMATGGRTLTGGSAIVGERGPERVMLPAGTAVLPASSGPANVSRSYSDTWNITGGGNPQDVANQLSRMLLLRRLTAGRDDW